MAGGASNYHQRRNKHSRGADRRINRKRNQPPSSAQHQDSGDSADGEQSDSDVGESAATKAADQSVLLGDNLAAKTTAKFSPKSSLSNSKRNSYHKSPKFDQNQNRHRNNKSTLDTSDEEDILSDPRRSNHLTKVILPPRRRIVTTDSESDRPLTAHKNRNQPEKIRQIRRVGRSSVSEHSQDENKPPSQSVGKQTTMTTSQNKDSRIHSGDEFLTFA